MRIYLKYFFGAFALMALALPAWARTDEMSLHLDNATLVGNKKLDPGDYQVKADEAKKDVQILRDSQVVAEVPGHWVDLSQKPEYDQASIERDHVTQMEFAGKTKSFVIG